MDMEIDALRAKEVLRQISRSEMPTNHRAINTMWVFDVKTDHLGYVVRFKASSDRVSILRTLFSCGTHGHVSDVYYSVHHTGHGNLPG